jgi:hypothetical protein
MSSLKTGRPSISKEKALKQLEENKNANLVVKINKSFHKEIKRYALEHDITLSELVHKSLIFYTNKHSNKEIQK